jgi:hypothetical protein
MLKVVMGCAGTCEFRFAHWCRMLRDRIRPDGPAHKEIFCD